MLSIGVDIEDISRFRDKNIEFLKKIFTSNELDYCFKNKNYEQHLCARFCAKEAVIKALSALTGKKPAFLEIEIFKKNNGAPYINILSNEFKNYEFLLSISHEKDKAVAFVVVK